MADTAEIRNTYSQDYRGFFVTDAAGGYNENGFLLLDFYNERQGFPESMSGEVVGGKVRVDLAGQPSIAVREFQARVYMTVSSAIRLRDFLNRQIATTEAEDNVQAD